VIAALLGCLPLLVEGGPPALEGGLALAASVIALEALIFAPSVLPVAVALYAAGLVVSVHRGGLPLWIVPVLSVGLLLLYETGELRHRLPPGSVVEAGPLRALGRRLGLTAALGVLASATVVAASSVPSRGGAAAAIVGGLAVAAALLLVRASGEAFDTIGSRPENHVAATPDKGG
jgi:hypothetical protein